MADGVFNVAKARAHQLVIDDATKIVFVLLKDVESDALLQDRTDLGNILAQAANNEADFTNYSRKTGVTATINVDQANDRVDIDCPDQLFTSAGGVLDNSLLKCLICYELGAGDANILPIGHYDYVVTTDGSDISVKLNAAGFFRAS